MKCTKVPCLVRIGSKESLSGSIRVWKGLEFDTISILPPCFEARTSLGTHSSLESVAGKYILSLSELLSRGFKGIQSLVSTILFMKNNEKKGTAVLSFVSRF